MIQCLNLERVVYIVNNIPLLYVNYVMEIFNNINFRANITLKTFNNLCRKNDIGTKILWRHNIRKQTINMIEIKVTSADW